MGLVDETYFNKEKHFLYLHWKWNDRDDTRSILTVLLLHFISDTRVEQVANEVYRASQGRRPGVLRLGCWSWLFQSPTWMIQFMGPFGAVHLKWSNVPWASSFFFKKIKKRAPAPVPFPSENETHRASSSLVAIKVSNVKVGCEAPGMLNYNLDIICAVQLRSSVKSISLFAQKRWKGGWLTSDETCIKWKKACSLSEWQSYKDSSNF